LEDDPVTGVDFLAGWIAGSIMGPHKSLGISRSAFFALSAACPC
jgi:uncharacterized membrane protein YeaQ/YmgE (transglycosylase-associated protein family)